MRTGDPRRKRQIILFLAAILIPTFVLITFAVRLARQDAELAEKRSSDQKRDALEQLRREISARLEAVKLQELNRLAGESLPSHGESPESPVIFTAPLIQNRLVLPWDTSARLDGPSREFVEYQKEGEAREFLGNDLSGALETYDLALRAAHDIRDKCAAMLWKSRVLSKAQTTADAAAIYRSMLRDCDATQDAEGMAFGLYAAERLISTASDAAAAREYVVNKAQFAGWLPPVQDYLLQSLLRDVSTADAQRARDAVSMRIHDAEQILALANDINRLGRIDFPFHVSPGKSVWLAYGDEPWLLTVMSTASFAPPVVLAVSSTKIAPPGVTFLTTNTIESTPILDTARCRACAPLGENFVDLQVEWPPGRFVAARSIPPSWYALGIGLILGITILAGYLLIRDVSREIEIAEMRSHFVASVSHELKTPLTAIRMFAETLAMGRAVDERTRSEYLQTVVNESERLSRLVDNVLDFSRIERGKKIYRMEPASLPEIVRAAAKAMQYPLTQQGFVLNVSIEEHFPTVLADADALEQAVLNLLANAMKYSGEAREVDLCLVHSDREAEIKVIDRGIGIGAEEQPRIFEKFYRVRSSSDRVAGTGLGLTLATHIVKAHGGQLKVSSELGSGSTFSICLPLQRAEA